MTNKSIEKVREHCIHVGYTYKDMARICGFLVAKGVKEVDEIISFCVGKHTLADFIKWFNSESFEAGDYVVLNNKQMGMILDIVGNNIVFFGANRHVRVQELCEIERACTDLEKEHVDIILDECGLKYSQKDKRIVLCDRQSTEGNKNEVEKDSDTTIYDFKYVADLLSDSKKTEQEKIKGILAALEALCDDLNNE